MWRLLPNDLSKAHIFILKLLTIITVGHVIALFFGFVLKNNDSLDITIKPNMANFGPIILLPMQKTVLSDISNNKNSSGRRKVFVASEKKQKKVEKQVNKNTSKKIIEKKSIKSTPEIKTVAKEIKKPEIKEQKKSPEQTKVIEKNETKPDLKTKPEPEKKVEPEIKQDLKKELKQENKVEEVPKKEEIKTDEMPKEVKQEAQLTQPEDPVYVGRKDLDAITLYENIQKEIVRHWKPPVGVSKNLECKVKIFIDEFGKISNYKIEKSSGVLVYDMSIKMTLPKVVLPDSVFNQEITLTFKP